MWEPTRPPKGGVSASIVCETPMWLRVALTRQDPRAGDQANLCSRLGSRRCNSLADHFFIFKAAPSKVVTMACISPSLVM